MTEKIYINIWDDYHEDGYVPEGEKQETYAYVECDITEEDAKNVLAQFQQELISLVKPEWDINLSLDFYDSAKEYQNLVGTEYEKMLFRRWQLSIKNLTHQAREYLIKQLQNKELNYRNIPIVVYKKKKKTSPNLGL